MAVYQKLLDEPSAPGVPMPEYRDDDIGKKDAMLEDSPPGYEMHTPGQPIILRTPVKEVPKDHFILAIFVTICCCWPLGIWALVTSRQVYKSIAFGDVVGARRASAKARNISIAAIVIGLIIIIIVAIVELKVVRYTLKNLEVISQQGQEVGQPSWANGDETV